MNKALLVGRLTRDPEIRYSQGENATAVGRFTVAVDRPYKKEGAEQTADFISCVAFGKTAEFIGKYFTKGRRIAIDGRIQTGSYVNKEGAKVYTTDVVVDHAEFCDSKPEGAATASSNTGASNTGRPDPAQASTDGFMNIPDSIDEDLPFN